MRSPSPHIPKNPSEHISHCPAEQGALTPPVSLLASSRSKTRAHLQQQQLPALLRWECYQWGEEDRPSGIGVGAVRGEGRKPSRPEAAQKNPSGNPQTEGPAGFPRGKGRVHSMVPRKPLTRVTPGHINTHSCQLD